MATNKDSMQPLSLVATDPTTPSSGDPVRFGSLTGVALNDEGGSIANETTVDVSMKVWDLVVDDTGGGAAVGAKVYYHDTQTGSPLTSLNDTPTAADAYFGILLDSLAADATTNVRVLHIPAQDGV